MKQRNRVDQIRESLRLQQVYNVFMRYGMDMLFDRGLLGDFRRFMQEKIYDPPQPLEHLSLPVKTRLMLQELGPTYVKMGQLISSQAQVLPADWETELVKLQSDVPPFPIEEVREIIQEQLGAPPEDLYAEFDPKPLAAASTAQVHRATLFSGEEVVVKVQRPNIRTQVRADLGIMLNASRVIERRSDGAKSVDLVGIIDEFGTNVIAELDYNGEAYNARRLARNMESIPQVHIPTIYTDLSTDSLLTLEFIDGVKVIDVEAIDAAGLDKKELADAALYGVVKQLLIDGFFHGDPHPGNVLVNLRDSTIDFIDTGMVGELDVNQRINVIQLLMVLRQRDVKGTAQMMMTLSVPFRQVNEKAYYRDFERKVGRYLEPGGETSMGNAVNVSLEVLRDNGMRLDSQLTLALKAMLQAETIARTLNPEASLIEMSGRMVPELLVDQITPENVTKVVAQQVSLSLREVLQRMPSLQDATVKWLDQYQKGRFELYVDTSGLGEELKKMRSFGRYVVIAIMLVGIIVGSSIAASVTVLSGTIGTFLSQFALISYAVATVLAILIILLFMWRMLRGRDED
jgi:ubiquinone biosynthesis protein